MSIQTCRKCGHWHGGVGTEPGNPCTHYVERLKAECGCTGVKADPLPRTIPQTELDALLDRVREDKRDTTGKNRNAVAYDCWRMFEDLAGRYKEEAAMRDRYKGQSNSWRDKALAQAELLTWKPIETAPRDGGMILIAHNHWGTVNVTLAAWGRVNYGAGQFEDGWRSYSGFLTGAEWWCLIPSVESLANMRTEQEGRIT